MGDTPAVIKKDTRVDKQKTKVRSSDGTHELTKEASVADRAVAMGKRLSRFPKSGTTIVDVSFPKDGAKLGVGKVKLGFKVKFIRHATSKIKVVSGTGLGVKSTLNIAPLATDYNPILKKYSASLASISGNADFGFIKIGLGSDLLKVNEKGEITSTIKASGKATLDYNAFQAYKKHSPLLQPLEKYSDANNKFEIIIQLEWALSPADIRKMTQLLKMKKELEQTQKLAKKNIEEMKNAKADFEKQQRDQVSKKNEKRKRKKRKNARKGKRGKANNKKFKVKKWEDSKAYKKFQQKSKDLAQKAKGQVKKMSSLSKTIKAPFLKKIATKILGKALFIVGVIDTLVFVAKIFKYWDHLKIQLPWGDGKSLDDAPLFGDVPKKATEGEKGELTSEENSLAKGETKLPSEEKKSQKETSESTEENLDIDEKIKALDKSIKELVEDMIDAKDGIKIKNKNIEDIIKEIPKDLTKEESERLRKMLISVKNKELAEILLSLIKVVKFIRETKEKEIVGKNEKKSPSEVKENPLVEEKTSKKSDIQQLKNYILGEVFTKDKNNKFTINDLAIESLKKDGLVMRGINLKFLNLVVKNTQLPKEDTQLLVLSFKLEVMSIPIKEESTYAVKDVLTHTLRSLWNPKTQKETSLIDMKFDKFLNITDKKVVLKTEFVGKVQTVFNIKGKLKVYAHNGAYRLVIIPSEDGGLLISKGKRIKVKKGQEITLKSDSF